MTPESIVEATAIVVSVLIAMFGSTWFISARMARMGTTITIMNDTLQKHVEKDERRFDEVFNQQRELATQHFWLQGNIMQGKGALRRGEES